MDYTFIVENLNIHVMLKYYLLQMLCQTLVSASQTEPAHWCILVGATWCIWKTNLIVFVDIFSFSPEYHSVCVCERNKVCDE